MARLRRERERERFTISFYDVGENCVGENKSPTQGTHKVSKNTTRW